METGTKYEGPPERLFEEIYEVEKQKDAEVHPNDQGEYSGFRILKNVLRNPFFGAVSLNKDEVYGLANRLISNNKTASDFREWIRVSEFEFQFNMLQENARKIYAIGRNLLEKNRQSRK